MIKSDDIFDISFTAGNIRYNGWVHPSGKINESGKAVTFHVVLNGTSFGYISYHNCQWTINEDRPKELVEEVGKQIEKHYQL